MIRRPPRSTQSRSSAASDVYKRQSKAGAKIVYGPTTAKTGFDMCVAKDGEIFKVGDVLSLIHISEPTRLLSISYAVFCLKKKKKKQTTTYPLAKHNY